MARIWIVEFWEACETPSRQGVFRTPKSAIRTFDREVGSLLTASAVSKAEVIEIDPTDPKTDVSMYVENMNGDAVRLVGVHITDTSALPVSEADRALLHNLAKSVTKTAN